MTEKPIIQKSINPKKLKVFMFNLSLPQANFLFDISNIILVLGAFLVLAGTWGVIKIGYIKEHFSDERISANEAETARAKESAALANKQTAEANLQIEKLKAQMAWRTFTKEQYDIMISSLHGHKVHLKLQRYVTDAEAFMYANNIAGALKSSGVIVQETNIIQTPPQFGILISQETDNSHLIVAKAFQRAGIPVILEQPSTELTITVGAKPPPKS